MKFTWEEKDIKTGCLVGVRFDRGDVPLSNIRLIGVDTIIDRELDAAERKSYFLIPLSHGMILGKHTLSNLVAYLNKHEFLPLTLPQMPSWTFLDATKLNIGRNGE